MSTDLNNDIAGHAAHHLSPALHDGLPARFLPVPFPKDPLRRSARLPAGHPVPDEVVVDVFRRGVMRA